MESIRCLKCEGGVHKFYDKCWACGKTWGERFSELISDLAKQVELEIKTLLDRN